MVRLFAPLLAALCCLALPARAAFLPGGVCTGVTTQLVESSASLTSATKIITGAASKQTYLCDVTIIAPNNEVQFQEGTGTNCATGTQMLGQTSGSLGAVGNGHIFDNATAPGVGLVKPGLFMQSATAGDDVCVIAKSATQVTIILFWAQQ